MSEEESQPKEIAWDDLEGYLARLKRRLLRFSPESSMYEITRGEIDRVRKEIDERDQEKGEGAERSGGSETDVLETIRRKYF